MKNSRRTRKFSVVGAYFFTSRIRFTIPRQPYKHSYIDDKMKEGEEGNEADKEAMKAEAYRSYKTYLKVAKNDTVLASAYKAILTFSVFLSSNEDKSLSYYKTKVKILKRNSQT